MLIRLKGGLNCDGGKASISLRQGMKTTGHEVLDRLKRSHLLWSSRRVEYWLSSTSSPEAALELSAELPQQPAISLKVHRRIKTLSTSNSSSSSSSPKSFITMAIQVIISSIYKIIWLPIQALLLLVQEKALNQPHPGSYSPLKLPPQATVYEPASTNPSPPVVIAALAIQIFSFALHLLHLFLLFVHEKFLNQSPPCINCKLSPPIACFSPAFSSPPSLLGLDIIPGHWAIELTGYIPNGRPRMSLLVNNSTTFASVLNLLVAMHIIPKKALGSFYIRHGVWGRIKPLSLSEKLCDKGVRHLPTLFLGLRVRGGSYPRRRVFVSVPRASYQIPSLSDLLQQPENLNQIPSSSNLLQQPENLNQIPSSSNLLRQPTNQALQTQDTNRETSKRKRTLEDDGDKQELATDSRGKGKENNTVLVRHNSDKRSGSSKGKEKENSVVLVSQPSLGKKRRKVTTESPSEPASNPKTKGNAKAPPKRVDGIYTCSSCPPLARNWSAHKQHMRNFHCASALIKDAATNKKLGTCIRASETAPIACYYHGCKFNIDSRRKMEGHIANLHNAKKAVRSECSLPSEDTWPAASGSQLLDLEEDVIDVDEMDVVDNSDSDSNYNYRSDDNKDVDVDVVMADDPYDLDYIDNVLLRRTRSTTYPPAISGSQPAVSGSQPTVSGSQPTVSGSQPTTPQLVFQPGCISTTGDLLLVQEGSQGFYERYSKRCNHNCPSTWQDTDWTSRAQEADFDEYDNSCVALEELNMCIYKPLNLVLCRPCQKLIDSKGLFGHLRKDHNKFVPNIPRTKLEFLDNWKKNGGVRGGAKHAFLVDHVVQAYSLKAFPERGVVVHRPLSFMGAPQIFDCCPACKRGYLNKDESLKSTKAAFRNHFSKSAACENSPLVKELKGAKWNPCQDKSWVPFVKERRYGQLVYHGVGGQQVFYLPESWAPSASASPPISTTGTDDHGSQSNANANMNDSAKGPVIVQDYVEALGWDKAFEIESNKTGKKVDLIDVWKGMLTSVPEHPKYSEVHLQNEAALERGLPYIRNFLLEYLQDANKYVKGCNDIFRRQLTQMNDEGAKKSKSMYRILAPSTLVDYKDALYDSVALLLRHRHVLLCGKVDVGQRARGVRRNSDEMQIDLHLSVEAKAAMINLYSFLVETKEDEEIAQGDLAIRVHRLLVGLLTSQTPADVKVGSLFEFVAILKSYRGREKGFGAANIASSMCTMLTYGLRTIVVHIARLRGGGPYAKPGVEKGNATAPDTTVRSPDEIPELEEMLEDEDDDEDEDGAGDVQEPDHVNQGIMEKMERLAKDADDLDDSACNAVVDKPNDTDEDLEDETIPDPYASDATPDSPSLASNTNLVDPFAELLQDDLLSALAKCSDWIANTTTKAGSMPTAFQRIKMIWLVVWPLALKVVGSTRVVFDETGHVLKYSSCHVSDHDIKLAALKNLMESHITKAGDNFRALLPSELAFEEFDISLSSLHDDMKSAKSIFEQEGNKPLFDGLVQKFMEALMDPREECYQLGKLKTKTKRQKAIQRWFDAEQELLETILGGMVLCTGIPARAFQIKGFRYKSSSSAERMRNVFICKQNVVIGFPKSKLYSRTIQEALWALPPGLSQTFLLYLGVIRPVSIELLTKELEEKPRRWSNSHIFAPAHSPVWSWEKMIAVIKSQTYSGLKIKLSIRELRHIISAIFRKHLPSLIEPVDMSRVSTANKQADHSQHTSNQYGQTSGYMTGLCMPDTEVDNFLRVSHAWQALLGIRSPGQSIQALLHKLPTQELQDVNRRIALDQVRNLLVIRYGLGGPDWERSRKVAQEKLEEQPFFPKPENNLLGDKVLVSVLAALLYGHGRVDCSDSAPIRGLAVDTVLEAVALIRLGLKEWNGEHRLEFKPLEVLGPIVLYKENTRGKMQELAHEFEDNWTELGLRTFNHAREKDTSTNYLNLIDNQEAKPHERIIMG